MLGLVLSGGAAKGYAHIGAIKVLEQEGVKPDLIVGASMGALVGGFCAAGFDAKTMEQIVLKIDRKMKNWLFKPTLSRKGFVTGKNVVRFLSDYLANKKIEEQLIRFAVVTTDIENDTEVIISKGDLITAIRAAISIPVVFMPYHYAGRVLIDGGFVNPLPISICQRLGAQKIIAVNVLARPAYKPMPLSSITPSGRKYNMKRVFEKTLELITARLLDYEIAKMKNGMIIDIDTRGIGMSQFEKGKEAIERGYQGATKYRSALKDFTRD